MKTKVVYMRIVDLIKALVLVNRGKIWESLGNSVGLYNEIYSQFRTCNSLSCKFTTNKGVRQGTA